MSSRTGLVPPRSASRWSSARQSGGAKKLVLSVDRRRSVGNRKTASPSLQLDAPNVLPVATNSDLPSELIPPGAQMPPPRARVDQLVSFRGSASETPTTQPR